MPAKRQEQIWKGWYSKGFRNKNEKHPVNICESNNFEKQVILPHSLYGFNSELARTLFSVESTGNIKFKMTCDRVTGDRCIWEEKPLINAC